MFIMGIFLVVAYFVLFSEDEPNVICDEIVTLMLDDPEHQRLHNDYPNILMKLHVYLDENCESMDESNPMNINP